MIGSWNINMILETSMLHPEICMLVVETTPLVAIDFGLRSPELKILF